MQNHCLGRCSKRERARVCPHSHQQQHLQSREKHPESPSSSQENQESLFSRTFSTALQARKLSPGKPTPLGIISELQVPLSGQIERIQCLKMQTQAKDLFKTQHVLKAVTPKCILPRVKRKIEFLFQIMSFVAFTLLFT